MPKFVVSYDLQALASGRNYASLWTELNRLRARQLLGLQWAMNIDGWNAAQVRDYFRRHLDPTDRILVMAADSPDWAGYNLLSRLDTL